MRIQLLTHTPQPEKVVSQAARICTSTRSVENFYSEDLIRKVIGRGHLSVLEHVSFSFLVEGVSRALSHQLVRHRLASFSQQSQRYTTTGKNFTTPHSIQDNTKACFEFNRIMDDCWVVYENLKSLGIPDEDARYVLPNAAHTNLVVTMNARELRHFFSLRTCSHAQWEIREMATQMLVICKRKAPVLFENVGPGCLVNGVCPEGNACNFHSLGRISPDRHFRSESPGRLPGKIRSPG